MDKWSRRRCGYGVDVSRGRERMWSEADWKGIVVSGTNLRQGSLAERSFEGRFGRGIVLEEDVIRRARPRIDFHVPGGYNTFSISWCWVEGCEDVDCRSLLGGSIIESSSRAIFSVTRDRHSEITLSNIRRLQVLGTWLYPSNSKLCNLPNRPRLAIILGVQYHAPTFNSFSQIKFPTNASIPTAVASAVNDTSSHRTK